MSEVYLFRFIYRVTTLSLEEVCINHNFEAKEANISDFKLLVVIMKINPQKNNWPQMTCKHLINRFPGSNWSIV